MTSRPQPALRPAAASRLTRKMSVDCLLDHYNSVVDAGGGSGTMAATAGSYQPGARPPSTLTRRSPSGYFTGSGSGMTSSWRSASVDSCGSSGGVRGSLSRPPLQLRTDLFRPYPSSVPAASAPATTASAAAATSLDGLLSVSVYCGRGLSSAGQRAAAAAAAAALQELYCVVAVDGVSRARTGVQSGAVNFDWDDRFVVDVRSCSALSFGVYSFDSRGGRHRLCFTASVSLPAVVRGYFRPDVQIGLRSWLYPGLSCLARRAFGGNCRPFSRGTSHRIASPRNDLYFVGWTLDLVTRAYFGSNSVAYICREFVDDSSCHQLRNTLTRPDAVD